MGELPTSLKVLLTSSAGLVSIWLSVKVIDLVKNPNWTADQLIYVGMAIAGTIGAVIWALGGAMGYNTFPATTGEFWWRDWIETILGVGLTVAVLAKSYYDGIYHPLQKRALARKAAGL